MVPDFIVVLSFTKADGTNDYRNYELSKYAPTDTESAYKVLKSQVFRDAEKCSHVNWVSVNIVLGDRLVTCMQDTLQWFNGVEYFKKCIGDMGGGMSEPVAYGFIDQQRNLRVELENGIVALTSM